MNHTLSICVAGLIALFTVPEVFAGPGASVPAANYRDTGPFKASVKYDDWLDTKRNRSLPIRITSAEGVATSQPVVLFSHGLGGSRDGGSMWAEHWASHGYLVVHIQHPGSDETLWKGKKGPVIENLRERMTARELVERLDDVHFVLAELARRKTAGETWLANADLTHIAMTGHSFGAQTTQGIAGQKYPIPLTLEESPVGTRIVAAIAFSPNAKDLGDLDRQFGSITMPFLSLTGTRDVVPLLTNSPASDRLLPYQHVPPGGKFLVNFDGADHMVLGGHELRRTVTPLDRSIQADVKAITLAFLDAYLRNDSTARDWLTNGSARESVSGKADFSSK